MSKKPKARSKPSNKHGATTLETVAVSTSSDIVLMKFQEFLNETPEGGKHFSIPMSLRHALMFEAFKAGMQYQKDLMETAYRNKIAPNG